ncbi:MAG: flippase activity-associated protein Agl23 [Vicinamibacterales bacterium]
MTDTRGTGWRGMGGWERLAWPLVLIAAASLRLWDLGVRAMTHDESLHAYFSFTLFNEGVYRHEPVYHGPLLYHLDALVFYLFGASDVTARLAPTLAGILLVAACWLLRDLAGRRGALAAALLATFSPSLLFYSRHLRNDIYIACVTLLWAYGAFRYLAGREARWRVLVTVMMGLAFITKEVSFITGAILGGFAAGVAALPARDAAAADRRRAAADLAVLMLSLVLPFASGAAFLALGWSPVGADAEAVAFGRGAFVVLALVAAAALAGARRFGWRAWLGTMGVFWGLQVAFFTTFFTNLRGGLVSGVVGSLGYWLTQHEVARGGQPWFYYGVIGLLYEFLPILLGGAAAAAGLWRLRDTAWDPVDPEDAIPAVEGAGREMRRLWLIFTIWWAVASWIAYAWAGERMPWLLVHQVLPLCLLAGWGAGRLVASLERAAVPGAAWLVVGGSALTLVTVVGVLGTSPFASRGVQDAAETVRWWGLVLVQAGLLGVVSAAAQRVATGDVWRLAALGVLGLAALVTARTSVQASFVNIDHATEPLTYAQAGRDVKRLLRDIEAIDARSGGQHQLTIAVDDDTLFPLRWYLRDFPNLVTWRADAGRAASAAVVVAGLGNRAARGLSSRGYSRQRGVLYLWPLQRYGGLSPARLLDLLRHADERRALWQIVMHRQYGIDQRQWPGRREFDLYLRDDAAALLGLSSTMDADAAALGRDRPRETPWAPAAVFAGPFAGRTLSRPAGVAVGRDGSWLVADAGNHRVVILEAHGALRAVIGGERCVLTRPGAPGCVDPDGAGPRAAGDGQFDEPSGVAAGPDGEVVVADAANGRLQVFAADGTFVRGWGDSGLTVPGTDDGVAPRLLGPRGLAVDATGRLAVADTGNRRLLFYGLGGQRQGALGPDLDVAPPLDAPTSVAADTDGTWLVADRRRVLRLDRFGRTLATWRVPVWGGQSGDGPLAVAADPGGRVWVADDASGHVLAFSPAGALLARLVLPRDGDRKVAPAGLAVEASTGRVIVVDRAGNRLLVMPPLRPES